MPVYKITGKSGKTYTIDKDEFEKNMDDIINGNPDAEIDVENDDSYGSVALKYYKDAIAEGWRLTEAEEEKAAKPAVQKPMSQEEHNNLSPVAREVANGVGVHSEPKRDAMGLTAEQQQGIVDNVKDQLQKPLPTYEQNQAEWEKQQHEAAVRGAEMKESRIKNEELRSKKRSSAEANEEIRNGAKEPTLEEKAAQGEYIIENARENLDAPYEYRIDKSDPNTHTITINTKDYTDRIVSGLYADADAEKQRMSEESPDYSAWGDDNGMRATQNAMAANKVDDPKHMEELAWKKLKEDEQSIKEKAAQRAHELQAKTSQYIDVNDFANETYQRTCADTIAKIRNMAVEREKPHNTFEGVMGGIDESIVGNLANSLTTTPEHIKARQQAADEWRQNAGVMANVGRSMTSFVADTPFFGMTGELSGMAVEQIAKQQLARYVARGLSEKAAARVIQTKLANSFGKRMADTVMKGVVGGAVNLGTYEGMSEAANQIAVQEFKPEEIMKSVAHGAATGSVLGVTGGAWGEATAKLSGAKKILSNVAGFGIEAGTFTATGEFEKWASGQGDQINWLEDFGENAAMILTMKAAPNPKNLLKMFNPKARQEPNVPKFSDAERNEILSSRGGRELYDLVSEGKSSKEEYAQAYEKLVNDPDVSFTSKQKVSYALTESMQRKTPEVTTYDIEPTEDGKAVLSTRAADGSIVEKIEFSTPEAAEQYGEQITAAIMQGETSRYSLDAGMAAAGELKQEMGISDEKMQKILTGEDKSEEADNVRRAFIDRFNLLTTEREMNEAGRIEEQRALPETIESNLHEDGTIHKATLYPNAENGGAPQEVFVTKGDIVMREDGTVDTEASSDVVYYKDADGNTHMASPDKFQKAEMPVSAEEVAAADETNGNGINNGETKETPQQKDGGMGKNASAGDIDINAELESVQNDTAPQQDALPADKDSETSIAEQGNNGESANSVAERDATAARRAELEKIADYDGNITPITVVDKKGNEETLFYKAGNINNKYGGIFAVDANGNVMKVRVADIVEIGETERIEDLMGNNKENGDIEQGDQGGREAEIKPIGTGVFGNIYNQFKGKVKEAITFLTHKRSGEAIDVLHHKDIDGGISLVWGNEKAGLEKIMQKHPEVLDNLQEIVDGMHIVQETDNRIKLESDTHFAVVSKEYMGEPRDKWLLTAYEKKNSALDNTMDTGKTPKGNGNDTATPESTVISDSKVTETSATEQENKQKNQAKRSVSDMKTDYNALVEQNILEETAWDEEQGQSRTDEQIEKSARAAVDYNDESDLYKEALSQLESLVNKSVIGRLKSKYKKGAEDRLPLSVILEEIGKREGKQQPTTAETVRQAEHQVDTNPTEAQKEAGNYKKGHVRVDGYDITIEQPKGSVRMKKDDKGNILWQNVMHNTYGYIRGTEGTDGDHIDVFLSDNPEHGNVYVIDQVNPKTGEFDEHKVMYGFGSMEEAREAYLSNYSNGWKGLGTITEVSKDEFKKWIDSSHRKTKPFAEYKSVKPAAAANDGNMPIKQEVSKKREKGENDDEKGNKVVSLQSEEKNEGDEHETLDGRQSQSEARRCLDDARADDDGSGDRAAEENGQSGQTRKRSLLGDVVRRSKDGKTWIEDVNALAQKRLGHGAENDVYLSADGRHVLKLNNFAFLSDESSNFDDFTNRIDAHNELFPDVPLSVEGFTLNDKGEVCVILSQPYLKDVREATEEEIDKYLEEHGFYTDMSGNWTDGDYMIADAKPSNVFVDGDGNMFFFDTVPYDYRRKGKPLSVEAKEPSAKEEARENALSEAEDIAEATKEEQRKRQAMANLAKARETLRKKGRYSKENAELGDYTDFRDYAMRTIATGGLKLRWSDDPDTPSIKGLSSHLGMNGSQGEQRKRIWLLSKDGLSPEAAAESLVQGYKEDTGFGGDAEDLVSVQDALDEILDIVGGYDTPRAMFDAAKERHFDAGENGYEKWLEEQYGLRFREVEDEDGGKSLVGIHNITEEKLRKALKMGGLANPSTAVIDISRQGFNGYGEISLIMPSNMVDKRTGKNVGTWSQDAWTPTYPQVERRFTGKGSAAFSTDLSKLPQEMQSAVRMGMDSHMDGRNGDGLAYMFLHERGEAPDMKRIEPRYSGDVVKEVSEATNGTFQMQGADMERLKKAYLAHSGITEAEYSKAMAEYKSRMEDALQKYNSNSLRYKKAQQVIDDLQEYGFDYDAVSHFVNDIEYDKKRAGRINDRATIDEANRYISEKGLQAEYGKWKDGLNDRYGIEEVLFGGFTPSGNRRYLPHTLENVSKLMKSQGRNGAVGIGSAFNNFAATVAKPKGKLSDIRKEKGKLTNDHGDLDKFREKWQDVYYELGQKCQPGAQGFEDYGFYRLAEAAQEKDPKKYLKDEYGIDFTDEDVRQLNEMVEAIRNDYPAMYFETKFERPVKMDEFAAAVVPDNADREIVEAMEKAGLPVFTYKAGDEAARTQAVREASLQNDKIRFRFIGEQGAASLDKAEENTERMDNLKKAQEFETAYKEIEGDPEKYKPLQEAAKAVRELKAEKSEKYPTTREDAEKAYKAIGKATNTQTGVEADFFGSAFNKNHREGGLFEKAIPALKKAFENSVFAFSEPDKLKGQQRPDGSTHKEHRSIRSFDNYVGKVGIDGNEYYVRYTVQMQPGQNGVHSHFVTNVDLYDTKNPANVASYRDSSLPARLDVNRITDAKLQRFFALASGNAHDFAKAVKFATGWERGADGKWRYEQPDFKEFDPNGGLRKMNTDAQYRRYQELVEKSNGAALFGTEALSADEKKELDSLTEQYAHLEKSKRKGSSLSELADYVVDDALFAAYPEIAELHIEEERLGGGERGYYENSIFGDRIVLDSDLMERARNMNEAAIEEARSVLIHEVQHAIQRIEGFAVGGNEETGAKIAKAADRLTDYQRNFLEDVAMYESMKDGMRPDYTLSAFLRDNIKDDVSRYGEDMSRDIASMSEEDLRKEYNRLKVAEERLTPTEVYHRLAGEVEARNAQSRMNMTDEERRHSLAAETEDVAREEQIILNEGGEMRKAVESEAERLHADVEYVEKVSDIENIVLRKAFEARSGRKAVYDGRNGKMIIVGERADDTDDAVGSVLHEALGHDGLRKYVGEEAFNDFLDKVYDGVTDEVRKAIDGTTERMYKGDRRQATEEHIAHLADDPKAFDEFKRTGLWEKIKGWLKDMLSKARLWIGRGLTDRDLLYLLWRTDRLRSEGKGAFASPMETARDMTMRKRLHYGENEDSKGMKFSDKTEEVYDEEERGIVERAKKDGTYMKAPNGKPTKLTEKQWAQVRTKAFKEWFGDWEKAARIEKLRKSEPVTITGNEIEPSDDLKQYRKNANEYGLKNLRGEYTNKETGNTISVAKNSIKEVTSHDASPVQYLSVAAIPQILENGIYIDTVKNEDVEKHGDVASYDYYVCGLKIGGIDYTVKAVVANGVNGERYYDHRLTEIEKGKLISLTSAMQNHVSESNNPLSAYKDKRLLSILQTNSSKVVDENGEPLVVYHGTPHEFTTFKQGVIFTTSSRVAADKHYGNPMPLFVNIKNANTIDYKEQNYDKNPLRDKYPTSANSFKVLDNIANTDKKNGYDGTIVLNVKDGTDYPINEYIVTDANNVKSAFASPMETARDMTMRKRLHYGENREKVEKYATEPIRDIEEANSKFNKRLQQLADGAKGSRRLSLGHAGNILRSAGIVDAEVVLDYDKVVRKGAEDYKNFHPFRAEDLKDLPKAINAPLAVFESSSHEGDKVILTEMRKDGKNFIVAVRTKTEPRRGGKVLEINEITTLYPKDAKGVISWINKGKGVYYNKEKAPDWLGLSQPHADSHSNQELISAANIVKNFENPSISEENISSAGDIRFRDDDARDPDRPRFGDKRHAPRKKKDETMGQFLDRLRTWEKNEMGKEAAARADDPTPSKDVFDRNAQEEYERAMAEWRKANGVPDGEDGAGTPPRREDGESPQDYAVRVADYESRLDKWKGAPDMFKYMKKADDEYRKAYEEWKRRYDIEDEASAANIYGINDKGKAQTEEDHYKNLDAERRMDAALSQSAGVDTTPEGAKRQAKAAKIYRRKDMESMSAEDALFIQDLTKRMDKQEKSAGLEKGKLREAMPYLIEADRRRNDIAKDFNESLTAAENHVSLTADDIKTIEPYTASLRSADTRLKEMQEKIQNKEDVNPLDLAQVMSERAAVATDMAKALNDAHAGDEEWVAVSHEFLESTAEIVAKPVLPRGMAGMEVTPEIQKVIDDIGAWYDEFYGVIEDAGLRGKNTGRVQNGYVNHVWDKERSDPQAYAQYVENYQRTKSPNMKQRSISTYMEGVELGLAPKFDDISKLLAYYSRSNIEAICNKRFLDDLSFINVDEVNKDGEVVRSLPLLNSEKPDEFDRDRYAQYYVPGVGDVYVAKDVKQHFDSVFGELRTAGVPDWVHSVGKGYDIAASTAKKIQLSFSGFHAGALTEVALAQMRPDKGLQAVLKYVIYDSLAKGTIPAYAHPDDFKDAARHLVQLGATQDYAAADVNALTEKLRALVKETVENAPAALKAAGKPLEWTTVLLDWANKGMDKMLWNYLHDGLKIAAFKNFREQIEARCEREGIDSETKEKLLDEAGQYVNDCFGGQFWELLNVTPAQQKWTQRLLLSPDWLVSTQRHFAANFGFGSVWSDGGFREYLKYNADNIKRTFGKDIAHDELRRFRSSNAKKCYIFGVCVFFYATMNALNAFNRWRDEQEEKEKAEEMRKTNPDYKSPYELAYPDGMKWYDYTMWGNAIGQQTHLFNGRYEDGSETYLRWGKQFREFPEMFIGRKGFDFPTPMIERFMGKANPMVGTAVDLGGALDLYAFNTNQETKDIQAKYGKQVAALAVVARHYMPFSVPTQADKEFKMMDLVMPSQKGFTRYKTVDYFKDFVRAGDMDGIARTYQAAVMNGVDAKKCLDAAIATVKAEQKEEMRDGVGDLPTAFERYDNAHSLTEKKTLKTKIEKLLAADKYEEFTKQDAVERVLDFVNGEEDAPKKENEKYLMRTTASDIRDDYRLNCVGKTAREYVKKVKAAKDSGNSSWMEMREKYGTWFEIDKACKVAKRKINKLKKLLGTEGNDDAATMEEIRRLRREAQEAVDGLDPVK